MFAVPAIYNAYGGNMTAAKYDIVFRRNVFDKKVSSVLFGSGFMGDVVKGLGKLAYTVLPSSEKAEIVVSCLGIINEVLSGELARVGVEEERASAQTAGSGEDLGSGERLLSGEEERERVARAPIALDGVDYAFRIESISVPVMIGRVDNTLFPASGLIGFAKNNIWKGNGLRNWVLAIVKNVLSYSVDEFLGIVNSDFGDAEIGAIEEYFEKLANYILAVVNSYNVFQSIKENIAGYIDRLRNRMLHGEINGKFEEEVEELFKQFGESSSIVEHVEVLLKVLVALANLRTRASRIVKVFKDEENDATLRAGAYLLVRTLVNYLRTLNHIEIGGNYYRIDELYYEDSQGTLRFNEQVVTKEDLERSLNPKAYVWRVDRRSVEGEIERSTENSILAAAEILAFEVPAHSDVHTLKGLQTAKPEQIPLTDLLVNMREGTVIPVADSNGRLERIIILHRGDKGYECIVWNGNLRINMLATLRTQNGNIVTWPVFLHIDVFGAYRERKTRGKSRASKFPGIDICLPYRQSILVDITSPGIVEIEVKVSGDLAFNPDVSVNTKKLEQYFRDFVTRRGKDDVKKAFMRLWELGIIKISSNVDADIDDIFEIVWDKIKNSDDKCRTIVALAKFYSQFPDRSSIERFSREYIESKKLASLVGEFLKQYMIGYLADLGESEKEALVRRTEKILEIFAKIPSDILDRILSDAATSGELSDDTKRFIGLLKEHRDDIGSLVEKLTDRDSLEYLVGLERYRREIYNALGKIKAKKKYINIVRDLRHRIRELIGESIISLYPVGLYKFGEKENVLSEIAPQALTQFTSLISQLITHSKLVFFDTAKKQPTSGRNIIRIATNLLGSGKTALAAAYLRAYIWLISRLGDGVGRGRNVYSIVREYICGNRDILREYGDRISEEEVKTLVAILRELFPNADFTKKYLKNFCDMLKCFITGKRIRFADIVEIGSRAVEELEEGKTQGTNLEKVKAWRSVGAAIRMLLGSFPKTPPNISPTLLQRALSILESYYSPATRILSSMIFVRPEAVGLATNLLALMRRCGGIEVDVSLAGNQRNSVEKIVRHLVYDCGDPRDALQILEDTLEEIGEEEHSEYERMAIGNLRLNIRELRVLSGETADTIWTQTRTLLKTILLLEASMKALTKGMSLSKTKLTKNGEIINTNNRAESTEAELTKTLEILTLSGQGGVQITENPNNREITIRIRSPAMKHLRPSTTENGENRENREATIYGNEVEVRLRYVEEEPGRGWVMVFMRDPTTDLAERYTIENLVRSGGNVEKIANGILPVFGGYMVRVINGEPCLTAYQSIGGRIGTALMRPIVFHNLETLALYYMSRKTAPYEDLVSKLMKTEELLEEGKIGKAQESIEDLNEALKEIKKTDILGLPQMLGEYVKRSIIAQTEKIIERLKTGKNPLNEVRRLISGVRILQEKLRGETDKVLKKIETIMNPQREDPAKALRELIAMIDDPQQETETETGAEEAENILTGAYAYVRYLEETRPELLQTKPRIPLREDLANQIRTGLIVGLMTTLGAVIGTIMLEATGGEDSPILDILNFEAPTLIWIVLGAALALITLYMLSRDEAIRNTDRKLTDVFLRYGKKVAISVVLGASIWTYAKQHGKEILGEMPMFVPLSGILWVWDEFDDFQDGVSRLKNTGSWKGRGLSDPFELWVLPLILGMFAVWFGVDEYKVMARIPGRWGFVRYVATINIPAPWDTVVYAIYSVLSFMIGNVAASGVRGVGWVFYTAASVVGSLIMRSILGEALALIL